MDRYFISTIVKGDNLFNDGNNLIILCPKMYEMIKPAIDHLIDYLKQNTSTVLTPESIRDHMRKFEGVIPSTRITPREDSVDDFLCTLFGVNYLKNAFNQLLIFELSLFDDETDTHTGIYTYTYSEHTYNYEIETKTEGVYTTQSDSYTRTLTRETFIQVQPVFDFIISKLKATNGNPVTSDDMTCWLHDDYQGDIPPMLNVVTHNRLELVAVFLQTFFYVNYKDGFDRVDHITITKVDENHHREIITKFEAIDPRTYEITITKLGGHVIDDETTLSGEEYKKYENIIKNIFEYLHFSKHTTMGSDDITRILVRYMKYYMNHLSSDEHTLMINDALETLFMHDPHYDFHIIYEYTVKRIDTNGDVTILHKYIYEPE